TGTVSGGKFHFANGGHPAPILLRPGEPARVLESRGRIIGIFPEVNIEKKTIDYKPGDRFVFFTDGLIEARLADGQMLGDENLIKVLESTRDLPGNAFADNVVAYYKESSATVDDDVTLF